MLGMEETSASPGLGTTDYLQFLAILIVAFVLATAFEIVVVSKKFMTWIKRRVNTTYFYFCSINHFVLFSSYLIYLFNSFKLVIVKCNYFILIFNISKIEFLKFIDRGSEFS